MSFELSKFSWGCSQQAGRQAGRLGCRGLLQVNILEYNYVYTLYRHRVYTAISYRIRNNLSDGTRSNRATHTRQSTHSQHRACSHTAVKISVIVFFMKLRMPVPAAVANGIFWVHQFV